MPHIAIGAPVGRIELRINRLIYELYELTEGRSRLWGEGDLMR